MDDTFTFTFLLGLGCAATWLASHWWHGRRLTAALQRIDKLGQARVLYEQHMAQTRRQIEQLNSELGLFRSRDQRMPTPSGAARPSSKASRPAGAPVAPAVPPRAADEAVHMAVRARAAAGSLAAAAARTPTPATRSLVSDLARLLEAGDLRRTALRPSAVGWQTTQPAVGNGWLVSELPGRPAARGAARDFADTQPM